MTSPFVRALVARVLSWGDAHVTFEAAVKDLHPDMNGGRRDDEARLSEVVWAWEQIRASRSFRD